MHKIVKVTTNYCEILESYKSELNLMEVEQKCKIDEYYIAITGSIFKLKSKI